MSKNLIVIYAGYQGFTLPYTPEVLAILSQAKPVDVSFQMSRVLVSEGKHDLEISIVPEGRLTSREPAYVAPVVIHSHAPHVPAPAVPAPAVEPGIDDDIPF